MNPFNRALAAALCVLGVQGAAAAANAAATQDPGFAPCADAATQPELAGSLCAIERVPGDPSGRSGAAAGAQSRAQSSAQSADISLFLRQFPAAGASRGQVWLVAGGPGESGASFYGLLPKLRETFPGYDLIVPDHRGTGFSTRMCPAEEAVASPGGGALEGAEWGSCIGYLNAHPAWARQFSQTNAAHDLKLLLARTPRTGKTYLYGVSYGTQLVLRTVALGAAGIDGIVLDSLVPLQDDDQADLSRRSLVADRVGRQVLAGCDASRRCSARMGEPVETIYRRVLARGAAQPSSLAGVPGGDPKRFFASLLDVPSVAWQIPDLIKELDEGGRGRLGAALAEVEREMAALGQFPQSPASMPLVMTISASENDLRPGRTGEAVRAEEAELLFSSSLPGLLVNRPVPLYQRDALFARLPGRLPPTLVIHGERDGKTPYDAALRHIAALRKAGPVTLYTAEGGGHFVLWSDRTCARNEVTRFVLGKDAPLKCVTFSSAGRGR